MGIQNSFIALGATGVTVTSGAASASVVQPLNSAGTSPKYIRIQSNGFCFIKLGGAGVTATTNDLYISPNEAPIIDAGGTTFVAYLQDTAAAKINITPLEG